MDSSPDHPSVSEDYTISLPPSFEFIAQTVDTPVPSPSSPSALPTVNPNELPQFVQLQWNCPYEPDCAQDFNYKSAFEAHLFDDHRCFPFRCLVSSCTASFKNKYELGTHLKSAHSKLTTYPCSKCSKIYTSYTKLRDHYFGLHATGLFRCTHPDCTQICTTRKQSDNHYRKHCPKHQPVHSVICTVCGKTLQRDSMRDHLLTHTDNRQTYQCTTCKVTFSTKHNLKRHTRLHSGARPYTCSVCTKSFTQLTHKKRHEERHLEPTLQCPECPRMFGGKHTLMDHLLNHRQKMKKDKEQAVPTCDTT